MFNTYIVFLEGMLGNGTLVLAVGCRLVLYKVQHASLLAECRADASRKLGKVVGRVEQAICQLPIAFIQSVVPLGSLVAKRASPVAEWYATVHATRCLLSAVVAVKRLFYFAKIVNTVVYGAITRFLAVYSEECFWISHDLSEK